jgi:hypothetical protein
MSNSPKKHVQLIDKIDIPAGVILSLWDLNKNSRISVEIDHPKSNYAIGEVFVMHGTGSKDVELMPATEKIDAKSLLIPRNRVPVAVKRRPVKFGSKRAVVELQEARRAFVNASGPVSRAAISAAIKALMKEIAERKKKAAEELGGRHRVYVAQKLSKAPRRSAAGAQAGAKKPNYSGRGFK